MEVWKNINGFDDYQVSNLGNVKSLKFGKERVLKQGKNGNGYLIVLLYRNNKPKTNAVHQLIATTFLNHKQDGHKLVVNHINFNKLDNRLENLEVVTNRENCNHKHIENSSKYVGVCWDKNANKWKSQIHINGIRKYIGLFNTELEAHNAYEKYLNQK